MRNEMSRRTALAAIAAVPVTNIMPIGAISEDPVFAKQREVQRLERIWLAIDELENKEAYYDAEAAWSDAELEMIKTPAATIAGVITKLQILWESITNDSEADIEDDQDAAIITHALADLRRLANVPLRTAAE